MSQFHDLIDNPGRALAEHVGKNGVQLVIADCQAVLAAVFSEEVICVS